MMTLADYFSKMFTKDPHLATDIQRPNVHQMVPVCKKKPNEMAQYLKNKKRLQILTKMDSHTPIRDDAVRFVCLSDTHTKLEQQKQLKIPDGDILLHAGDLTMFGLPDEVRTVNEYLGTLPHRHKVVIAGNHDITFDLKFISQKRATRKWELLDENFESKLKAYGVKSVHEILTNCIYLQDSMVEIYGIKIYGSPWQPGSGFWGFQCQRGKPLADKWNLIPDDTDILLTHCPPCGYGDDTNINSSGAFKSLLGENHIGCVDLLNNVQVRVKPKFHVFGHIHEGYGVYTDSTTTFINASVCTDSYLPTNPPLVFDVPLPKSYNKNARTQEDVFLIETNIGQEFLTKE